MIDAFESGFKSKDNVLKSTLARSVKYSGQKADSNVMMFQLIAALLLDCDKNADPNVKKHSLEGLNSIVYKNWTILKTDIKRLEAFAYQETPIRKELIEEVDLGPFKQKRDNG
jgi:cullin-associated NEDD8-dissociated protein 1